MWLRVGWILWVEPARCVCNAAGFGAASLATRGPDMTGPPPRAPQALAILFAVSEYCQKHGISTDIADGRSPSDQLSTVLENNQQVRTCALRPHSSRGCAVRVLRCKLRTHTCYATIAIV